MCAYMYIYIYVRGCSKAPASSPANGQRRADLSPGPPLKVWSSASPVGRSNFGAVQISLHFVTSVFDKFIERASCCQNRALDVGKSKPHDWEGRGVRCCDRGHWFGPQDVRPWGAVSVHFRFVGAHVGVAMLFPGLHCCFCGMPVRLRSVAGVRVKACALTRCFACNAATWLASARGDAANDD